ncbi:MAG: AMP-binding protein, partial [Gemmatimonadetes bacterium]|nr:AMP-binding protein [Gemmatimonadota bacterium]
MQEPFNATTWLLDRHIEAGDGERVAVVEDDRTWTYAQVADEVTRVGAALRALGVTAEQRVALVLLDSIEFVTAFLGAMRIGAVPVPINPLLPGRDLGVIAAESRATAVIASATVAGHLSDLVAGAPELGTVITTGSEGSLRGSADLRTLDWATFLAEGETGDSTPYPTWAESPGFWLCTSGSTGRPRLATHRHVDIPVTCETYGASVLDIGPDDRCFSVGPLFHAYGLGNALTFPFSVGASAVLEPHRPPTPERVAEIVTRHRPTLFFCIPTFYAALNSAPIPDDAFASVRVAVSAAEPLPAETYHRFRERFGVHILDGIGSTELLHIYLSNTLDDLRP